MGGEHRRMLDGCNFPKSCDLAGCGYWEGRVETSLDQMVFGSNPKLWRRQLLAIDRVNSVDPLPIPSKLLPQDWNCPLSRAHPDGAE